jgi:hypothetical protein
MVSRLSSNFIFQWIIILFALVVLRGSEGLGERLNLDVSDTIVYAKLLQSDDFPEESIAAQYARGSRDVGITLLPNIWMFKWGLSGEQQFIVMYVVQMVLLSLGVTLCFRAFNRESKFILFATFMAFLSGFAGFGRYLAIAGAFKIIGSGIGLATGFVALGLYLHNRRYSAAVLSGLLAAYHPSHAFVALSIIGGHALWSTFRRAIPLQDLIKLGLVTAASLLPFIFLTLLHMPTYDFDEQSWWSFLLSKTSNFTPLQDGLMVVFPIVTAVACGFGYVKTCIPTQSQYGLEFANHIKTVFAIVLILWACQILASEILHSVMLTQLALTRSTPYAVLLLVALFSQQIYTVLRTGGERDKLCAALFALGAFGAGFPPRFFGIPTFAPAIIDTNLFYDPQIVKQASVAILLIVSGWWTSFPFQDEKQRQRSIKLIIGLLVFSFLFFGIRLPFLASAAVVYLQSRSHFQIFPILMRRSVIVGAIVFVAVLVFVSRNPWQIAKENTASEILQAVEEHVPENGTVLTLPFDDPIGEYLIPERAVFLGWGESQYMFYMPSLVGQVMQRLLLLGIDTVENDPVCNDWLLRPMCRRNLFSDKAKKAGTVWRTNITEIKRAVPSLTHVFLPSDALCPGDKVITKVQNYSLLPIEGVAQEVCTN